jgi:hypothetical protein
MLRTIDLYEQLSFFEGSKDFASELEALYQQLASVRRNLDQKVVGLVNDLQTQIMNDKLPSKRGFFTRVHNWWKNLFGSDRRSNPYYWQNKIGALGRTDLEPPTVREYAMLKNLADTLWEDASAAPQPLIRKILNNWTARLRQTIASSLDDMMNRVRSMATRVGSTPAPEKPRPTPEPTPEPRTPTVHDDDFVPGSAADDEGDDGSTAPLKPAEKPELTLDKQAEKFGIFKDTRTTFGIFGKLDDSKKRLIIGACRSGHCPKNDTAEDKYPLKEIHAATNRYLELFRQKKKKGDAWSGLNTREQEILRAIHEPWNKLGKRKNLHNNRGNNGKRITNRSQSGPFTLPKVLRIDDPRHEILSKYYPEFFNQLDLAGRVERPDDTEDKVTKRIARLLRKDKEEGHRSEDEKPEVGDRAEIHNMSDENPKDTEKRSDFDDLKALSSHDKSDNFEDNPETAAVQQRLYEPQYEEFASKIEKVVKTDRELVKKLMDTWDHISDSKTLRRKFLKLIEAGKYKDIQAMSSEKKKKKTYEDDDEEVKKHFGEGVSGFKQKMRAVSERIYRES